MSEQDTETIFELQDVQVETLGLVNRGANQEDFFLLKSEDREGDETSQNKVQESHESKMEEKITKSVWQKLIDLFKTSVAELPEEETVEEDTVVEEKQGVITEQTTEEVIEEKSEELIIDSVTEKIVTEKNMGESKMAEEQTAEVITKAMYDDLATKYADIAKELEAEKIEKAKISWVNKAAGFGYVPVASKELGEHLYNISKYDAKEADWLVDLLKSYDAMLQDSGFFMEKGTSTVESDVIEKAMKADNVKDALLALPRSEAERYLREMRARVRG